MSLLKEQIELFLLGLEKISQNAFSTFFFFLLLLTFYRHLNKVETKKPLLKKTSLSRNFVASFPPNASTTSCSTSSSSVKAVRRRRWSATPQTATRRAKSRSSAQRRAASARKTAAVATTTVGPSFHRNPDFGADLRDRGRVPDVLPDAAAGSGRTFPVVKQPVACKPTWARQMDGAASEAKGRSGMRPRRPPRKGLKYKMIYREFQSSAYVY